MSIIIFNRRFISSHKRPFHELGHKASFADSSRTHDHDSVCLSNLHDFLMFLCPLSVVKTDSSGWRDWQLKTQNTWDEISGSARR